MDRVVLDVVAWVCVQDGRMLCARTRGNEVFYLPGGKRQAGESDWAATAREVREEIGVRLVRESFVEWVTVRERAHGHGENAWVEMRCFVAGYVGEILPAGEIEEVAWLGYEERERCAPATQRVFEKACAVGLMVSG